MNTLIRLPKKKVESDREKRSPKTRPADNNILIFYGLFSARKGEQSVIKFGVFTRERKNGNDDISATAGELALRDQAEGKLADLLRYGAECKST